MNSRVFYLPVTIGFVDVIGGAKYGTKYDFTRACQKCGSGALPVGPLYLEKNPSTKYQMFKTLDHETLVDIKLAQTLRSMGINTFAEVYDQQKQKLPYMELRHQAQLPKFSKKTSGYKIEDQCETCMLNGHFNNRDPLKLVYENIDESITNNHVLATFELFGNSFISEPAEDSIFATPFLIFSKELKELLENEGIPELTFDEVLIN